MSIPRFIEGEGISITLRFTDPDTSQPVDPSLPVVVTIDPPPGHTTSARRTVTATRVQSGVFRAATAADIPGWWTCRGESAGTAADRGVAEAVFEVLATRLR